MYTRRRLIETAGALALAAGVGTRLPTPIANPAEEPPMPLPQVPPGIGASVALLSQNTAVSTLGLFGSIEFDRGNCCPAADFALSQFRAPVKGIYVLTVFQQFVAANGSLRVGITANTPGAILLAGQVADQAAAFPTDYCGASAAYELKAGDTVNFPMLFAAAAASGPGRAMIALTERTGS